MKAIAKEDFNHIIKLERSLRTFQIVGIIIGVALGIVLFSMGLWLIGLAIDVFYFSLLAIIYAFGMAFVGMMKDVRQIRGDITEWKQYSSRLRSGVVNEKTDRNVSEVLEEYGFGWFVPTLTSHGIKKMSVAKYLTDDDLYDMGVEKMYLRKTLLYVFAEAS